MFKDESDTEIVVLYRQYDGYPEGHGTELAQFLASGVIVNGITSGSGRQFNGMGDLTAQVVADMKTRGGGDIAPGGFYLHPPGTRDAWEEFIYTVSVSDGVLTLHVTTDDESVVLFHGTPEEFLKHDFSFGDDED